MRTYSTKQVAQITNRDINTIGRWIRGENAQHLKLKTTRGYRKRHQITQKDLREFLLKLSGF